MTLILYRLTNFTLLETRLLIPCLFVYSGPDAASLVFCPSFVEPKDHKCITFRTINNKKYNESLLLLLNEIYKYDKLYTMNMMIFFFFLEH